MNQYLIILSIRLGEFKTPVRALVVPDLQGVASFDSQGYEFIVLGFDGSNTRQLTDAEMDEWEWLTDNQNQGVQNA